MCDCEMRWYRKWYNDGWQEVDEDHIRDTDCTDPYDGKEHNIAEVSIEGPVSSLIALSHVSHSSSFYLSAFSQFSVHSVVLFWYELRLVMGYSWPNLGKLLNYNLLATQNLLRKDLCIGDPQSFNELVFRWTCLTCSVPRRSRSPRPRSGLCQCW